MDGDLKPWKHVRTPGESEIGGTTRERNEALAGSTEGVHSKQLDSCF